jgi:hypothetical protein
MGRLVLIVPPRIGCEPISVRRCIRAQCCHPPDHFLLSIAYRTDFLPEHLQSALLSRILRLGSLGSDSYSDCYTQTLTLKLLYSILQVCLVVNRMVAYRNILPSLTQEERAEQHRQAAEEEVERSRTASLNTSRDSTQFPNSGPNSAHAQPVNWMGTSMGIHLPQQLTDQQLGFGQQPDLNQQLRHIGMFGDMGFDPQQQPGQQPDFNQQQQQQSHHSQQIDYHNQSHQSQDLGQGQQGDGSHQFGYAPMVHFDGMPMQSETDFHQQIHNNSLWSGVPGSHPYTMGMLTGNSGESYLAYRSSSAATTNTLQSRGMGCPWISLSRPGRRFHNRSMACR